MAQFYIGGWKKEKRRIKMDRKINIAIAGGPCTGKSTLAAVLFAKLKILGYDYDLITEECRKLKKEFGAFRSPFERIYMWQQQEREELRSGAKNGFITDYALFQFYVTARRYIKEERDKLAVRELFRMCLEKLGNRYQFIVIPEDPLEIPFKNDAGRFCSQEEALARHESIASFVKHFWPEELLFVRGDLEERANTVIKIIEEKD